MSKYKGPSNSGETKIYLVSIGDLLMDYLQGIIAAYENNRAGIKPGGVTMSRVKSIVEDFKKTAIGAFHLSDNGNGTNMSLDAHHRFAALKLLHSLGLLTDAIKEQLVPVVVVHDSDALPTYQRLNASKGHSGQEKIMNPDFLLGGYMNEWMDESGVTIPGNFAMSLVDIALTREKAPEFTIEQTWGQRTATNELLDTAKDKRNFQFSESTCKSIVNALKVYKVICSLAEEDENYSEFSKKTLANCGFFQTVIADYVSNGKAFGGFTRGKLKSVAKKLNSKSDVALRYSMTVSRRNAKFLKDAELAKLLS